MEEQLDKEINLRAWNKSRAYRFAIAAEGVLQQLGVALVEEDEFDGVFPSLEMLEMSEALKSLQAKLEARYP